jgi:hypothetical protein
VTVLVEEALRAGVPVLAIDVKGDLPNLLLAFPSFDAARSRPWVEPRPGESEGAADALATRLAEERQRGLEAYGHRGEDLSAFARATHVRVSRPARRGRDAARALRARAALGALGHRSRGPRAALARRSRSSCASSGATPIRQEPRARAALGARRAHLAAGETADIARCCPRSSSRPSRRSARSTSTASSRSARESELAAALNTCSPRPSFASWRAAPTLDVGAWLEPHDGRTPATILSVAHLDDEERALVLGVVLEEVLAWVRSCRAAQRLRALIVFDEVYGFLPPHPASPPTKRPLVALMKQARAFGVGVVIATQNPMDLDYRALSQRRRLVPRPPPDRRRPRARARRPRRAREEGDRDASALSDVLKQLCRGGSSCATPTRAGRRCCCSPAGRCRFCAGR